MSEDPVLHEKAPFNAFTGRLEDAVTVLQTGIALFLVVVLFVGFFLGHRQDDSLAERRLSEVIPN